MEVAQTMDCAGIRLGLSFTAATDAPMLSAKLCIYVTCTGTSSVVFSVNSARGSSLATHLVNFVVALAQLRGSSILLVNLPSFLVKCMRVTNFKIL